MNKLHLLGTYCFLSIVAFQPFSSQAELITFNFTAEITRLGQVNSFGGTSIGDTFSGSFTFESTVSDSPTGFYNFVGGSPIGLTTQVGTESVVLSDFLIRVFNDTGGGVGDSYEVSGSTGPASTDTFFTFVLVDSTSSVFSDVTLPLTPPSLASFDQLRGEVRGQQASTLNPFSEFIVTSLTLNAVPVPAAVWLFGSGIIGLVGLARRKT